MPRRVHQSVTVSNQKNIDERKGLPKRQNAAVKAPGKTGDTQQKLQILRLFHLTPSGARPRSLTSLAHALGQDSTRTREVAVES
jgi:hypothetical protein